MKKLIFNIVMAGCLLSSCTEKSANKRPFEHVVVIGVDGLTVEGLKRAATPVMDNLIANGVVTYDTRTIWRVFLRLFGGQSVRKQMCIDWVRFMNGKSSTLMALVNYTVAKSKL